MSTYRMAPADAAWLHMDRRTNRSVVTMVMWFDEALDPEAWRAVLQSRLIERFPRFSQRVVDRTTSVWWEDVDDYAHDYKGLAAGIKIDPKSGAMSLGWEVMLPPFDYDIGDAGKNVSDGWFFLTSYNTER